MNRSEGGAGAVLAEDQIGFIEPGDHLPGGHLIANIDEPLDDLTGNAEG
jgi:hypothetical protein